MGVRRAMWPPTDPETVLQALPRGLGARAGLEATPPAGPNARREWPPPVAVVGVCVRDPALVRHPRQLPRSPELRPSRHGSSRRAAAGVNRAGLSAATRTGAVVGCARARQPTGGSGSGHWLAVTANGTMSRGAPRICRWGRHWGACVVRWCQAEGERRGGQESERPRAPARTGRPILSVRIGRATADLAGARLQRTLRCLAGHKQAEHRPSRHPLPVCVWGGFLPWSTRLVGVTRRGVRRVRAFPTSPFLPESVGARRPP